MNEMIRIFTVDDHEIFRKGLNMVLEQIPDFIVIGDAVNGKDALKKISVKLNPDVLITDIRMPELNGIELTKQIKEEFQNIKIIAISMFGEETYLEEIISAGANGFILKT